jgi:Na+/H+ antiporter NhaB
MLTAFNAVHDYYDIGYGFAENAAFVAAICIWLTVFPATVAVILRAAWRFIRRR